MSELDKNVDHPQHYLNATVHLNLDLEPIDLCECYNFCMGNAIKYILRSPFKGKKLEDLMKAEWYLRREATTLDSELEEWEAPLSQDKPYIFKAFRDTNHFLGLLLDNAGYYSTGSLSKTIAAIEEFITEDERATHSERFFEAHDVVEGK